MATKLPPNDAHFTLDEVMTSTGGILVRQSLRFSGRGVVSDSRSVEPGAIFVALRGELYDGHAFVPAAVSAGASILVVEHGRKPAALEAGECSVIEVRDTLSALGFLAGVHLARWRAAGARQVVAITGSAGKTTTKELTRALLSVVGRTHATAGNLNNRVGVPHVVFALEDEHRFAVLEMGMSLPGELETIAHFATPDASVITNIGVAHSEGVGGIEGVANEKAALYRALGPAGIAIVNADDDRVVAASRDTKARRSVTFGTASTADIRLVHRTPRGEFGSTVDFSTRSPARDLRVQLPIVGDVAALDLAAAIAVQEAVSGIRLSASDIDTALASVRIPGRSSMKRLGEGILLVDDTYNANPASVRAALANLGDLGAGRRRVVILGEMRELGPHAEAEHVALGDALAEARVSLAIGCGGLVALTLERAASLGVQVIPASTTLEAAHVAEANIRPFDVVLVKGSRGVGTETVAAALSALWPALEAQPGSDAL